MTSFNSVIIRVEDGYGIVPVIRHENGLAVGGCGDVQRPRPGPQGSQLSPARDVNDGHAVIPAVSGVNPLAIGRESQVIRSVVHRYDHANHPVGRIEGIDGLPVRHRNVKQRAVGRKGDARCRAVERECACPGPVDRVDQRDVPREAVGQVQPLARRAGDDVIGRLVEKQVPQYPAAGRVDGVKVNIS